MKSTNQRAREDKIIAKAIQIIEARMVELDDAITSPEGSRRYIRKWLQLRFQEAEREFFGVVWMATSHQVIQTEVLFMGSISSCTVAAREVAKSGLGCNASAGILFHNHPSGNSQPSQADKNITRELQSIFDLLDMHLLDHLIVGKNQIYSFAEHGIL